MSTFIVEDTFTITDRGTVVTGRRVGPLHTGQYLYGPRFGFQIRGIEQFLTVDRDKLPEDNIGILVGPFLAKELFVPGDTFTTEKPDCEYCLADYNTNVCYERF